VTVAACGVRLAELVAALSLATACRFSWIAGAVPTCTE
jgi:hypothetical protein